MATSKPTVVAVRTRGKLANNSKRKQVLPPVRIEYVRFVLSFFEMDLSQSTAWRSKYVSLRGNANRRGIACTLDFADYLELALSVGLDDAYRIGRHRGHYHLSRNLDLGGYTLGNCSFKLAEVNVFERTLNGGSQRAGDKKRGRNKHNDSGVALASLKRSKPFRVVSPKGKVFTGVNITDFCKKHGIHGSNMSEVCAGRKPHAQGWTGEYL